MNSRDKVVEASRFPSIFELSCSPVDSSPPFMLSHQLGEEFRLEQGKGGFSAHSAQLTQLDHPVPPVSSTLNQRVFPSLFRRMVAFPLAGSTEGRIFFFFFGKMMLLRSESSTSTFDRREATGEQRTRGMMIVLSNSVRGL